MEQEDRERLVDLLTDLIGAQDAVTHMNEKGPRYAQETMRLVAERNGIRNKILELVDSLIERKTA